MKLALALCVVAAASADFDAIVKHINHPDTNATWTAGAPTRSMADFKAMCGTYMPGHPKYVELNLPEYGEDLTATFEPLMTDKKDLFSGTLCTSRLHTRACLHA